MADKLQSDAAVHSVAQIVRHISSHTIARFYSVSKHAQIVRKNGRCVGFPPCQVNRVAI